MRKSTEQSKGVKVASGLRAGNVMKNRTDTAKNSIRNIN